MKSMINNDLGRIYLTDECESISIDALVFTAKRKLRKTLLLSEIEINNLHVSLTNSTTGNGGERYWFLCPLCNERRGIIFKHPLTKDIGCRQCLGLKYRKNAKKGMIENQFN